jgi:predicted permease
MHSREERSWYRLEQILQDVRLSLRALSKNPGFSITAVLTLALGIGANTAIFSLIDSVMLKTLPVAHPEQLLQVNIGGKDIWGVEEPFLSNPVWEQLRDRQQVFSGIFSYTVGRFNLANRGEARYVQGNYVSGQFFETLGLRPVIGRTFTAADDRRGCAGTAVLGYGFWQSKYAGRSDVVGQTISLDNHPFEILGVIGPGFTGVDVGRESNLYVPVCTEKIISGENSSLDDGRGGWLHVIGRPKSGISANAVQARLKTLTRPIFEETIPPNLRSEQRATYLKRTLTLQLAASGISSIRSKYRQALMVLMLIVGVVLLIACANVANLSLARSAARQREFGICIALGAGRGRLVQQLLTESLLLSLSGAVLGILFAQWVTRLLVGLLSSNVYRENKVFLDLSIDSRVLAFTAGVAILTVLVFGLAPAWKSTRVNPQLAMKANAYGVTKGGAMEFGKLLIVAQVALSLVLVVGAGLLLTTFFKLETLNPGFEREHVLLVDVDVGQRVASPARRPRIFGEMLEQLRALTGVRSASFSDSTPIGGSVDAHYVQVEGYSSKSRDDILVFDSEVSDRYFETLGTALLAGRDFNVRDSLRSPKVAIVNQTMAKKFFGGQNPIGKRYQPEQGNRLGEPVEIIGVVKDVKYVDLREDVHPFAYVPVSQDSAPGSFMTFELRSSTGSATSLISAVKSSIARVNPDASLQFKTLAVQIDESLARERLLAMLSGFFGGLALALAMIGLYGVMSYNVTGRRHEIGIRMALGAERSRVLRMVLGRVATLIGIGLTIGVGAAIATSRLIVGFLYGVQPNDPKMLFFAASLLALAAGLAGFFPAYRASHLDPIDALREE